MNKLKEFGNAYFWMIVAVWIVGICIAIYLFSAWQDGATNRTVTSQTNQANTAVKQAQNAANVAANAEIERRAEDAVREKVIAPKLDNARRKSQNSKAEIEAARKTYHDKKNDTSNLAVSAADNCRKLGELFPNVRFDDCR